MAAATLIALSMSGPSSAQPVAAKAEDKRFAQAVRLHDAGDYDGAIRLYREILAEEPGNGRVIYELMYSTHGKGDRAGARKIGEEALAKGASAPPDLYVLLGTIYDVDGETAKGEAMFRRGLALFPENPLLHFNLAINQMELEAPGRAARSFMDAIERRPDHASSWLFLGEAARAVGRPGDAFAALARFLSLEPDSKRSPAAAQAMWDLLFAGVTRRPGKNAEGKAQIDVQLPPPSGVADEAGLKQATVLALTAAGRYVDKWESRSDAAFFPEGLRVALATLSEQYASDQAGRFWKACAFGYFDAAREAGHLEALAYHLRRAAGDPEVARWIEAHPEPTARYQAWSRAWKSAACTPDARP